MKISIVPGAQLSDDHLRAWVDAQDCDDRLASPFLCPEFTQVVAAVRPDVQVAVMKDADGRSGFFSYQRGAHGDGEPVGAGVNNLQGLVAMPGFEPDLSGLLRACNLRQIAFDRVLAFQSTFKRSHVRRHRSGIMDLSRGYDAYLAARCEASAGFRKVRQLARKLERERGPLHFEFHSPNRHAIATLMRWKFDLYRHRGYADVYAEPWIRRVVDRIHATQTPRFAGVLSLLFAGGELAAGHLGLRGRSQLHHWFPAYNPSFASYSPGMILMLEIAKHAPAAGVRHMELGGFDDYLYKRRLMTHSIELAEGIAHVNPAIVAAQRVRVRAEQWIRSSRRLHPVARTLRRYLGAIRRRVGSAAE